MRGQLTDTRCVDRTASPSVTNPREVRYEAAWSIGPEECTSRPSSGHLGCVPSETGPWTTKGAARRICGIGLHRLDSTQSQALLPPHDPSIGVSRRARG
jgi:hypothetical protein